MVPCLFAGVVRRALAVDRSIQVFTSGMAVRSFHVLRVRLSLCSNGKALGPEV